LRLYGIDAVSLDIPGKAFCRQITMSLSGEISRAQGKGIPYCHATHDIIFAYAKSVPSRSCQVSFTDSDGIEHSVRVPAESLYEAAVEAIAAFRRSVPAEMPLGPATRLTIRVNGPEEEHTVTIGKVLAWLDGVTTSPSEKLKKNRLKERLRM
jgi:hypothetical protein